MRLFKDFIGLNRRAAANSSGRHRARTDSQRARRRQCVLGLEPLEDRVVLSTFLVTNTMDNTRGQPLIDGSLRQAIALSDSTPGPNEIDFASGLSGTITLRSGQLTIANNAVTLVGPGANVLSVSGNQASPVLQVSANATIQGLTIGGSQSGSGISNSGDLTLVSVMVNGNNGDGIYNTGHLTITDSTISGNGRNGVYISADARGVEASNSTISGNRVDGIASDATYVFGRPDLSNLTAPLTIVNCTITKNGQSGLDRLLKVGVLTETGGGSPPRGKVLLINSIVATNNINDLEFISLDDRSSHNLVGDGSGGPMPGNGNIVGTPSAPIDPMLSPLAYNGGPTQTMALLPGSPAIDAGDSALNANTDQRGAQRGPAGLNAGRAPDIGAYEASSSYLVTNTADDGSIDSLRTAVSWANVSTNANLANVASPAPNTIYFDKAGKFATAQTITLTNGPLILTNTSTPEVIQGPGENLTAVSGNNKSQVFEVDGANTAISGLTITGGNGGRGGGLFNNAGTVTISSSTISGNHGGVSGGLDNERGTMIVTSSTIIGNNASGSGGGITNRFGGTLQVSGSDVLGNQGGFSGGIDNEGGFASIFNSTISGNGNLASAEGSAGGGVSNSGIMTIASSTISGNFNSGLGGGGVANAGTLRISNSTVNGNRATSGSGGGILNFSSGTLTITDGTISDNTAPSFGGGIDDNGGRLALVTSTVTRNSAATGGGVLIRNGGGLTISDSTVSDNTGGDIIFLI